MVCRCVWSFECTDINISFYRSFHCCTSERSFLLLSYKYQSSGLLFLWVRIFSCWWSFSLKVRGRVKTSWGKPEWSPKSTKGMGKMKSCYLSCLYLPLGLFLIRRHGAEMTSSDKLLPLSQPSSQSSPSPRAIPVCWWKWDVTGMPSHHYGLYQLSEIRAAVNMLWFDSDIWIWSRSTTVQPPNSRTQDLSLKSWFADSVVHHIPWLVSQLMFCFSLADHLTKSALSSDFLSWGNQGCI